MTGPVAAVVVEVPGRVVGVEERPWVTEREVPSGAAGLSRPPP
ncbi:hypothetical protein [Streptomyces griseus]|nr:hypothetical protein [Streptomyces griseus]